jgi:hypothetical protein
MTIGVLAVATSAYVAAVYLAADARWLSKHTLALDFRTRALRPVSSRARPRSPDWSSSAPMRASSGTASRAAAG